MIFYEFYSKKKTWKITRYKICFRKETFRTRVNARTHSVWKIINSNVPFVLSLFRRSRINKHSRVRVSHTYSPSPLLQDKHSCYVLSSVYTTILNFAVHAFYAALCSNRKSISRIELCSILVRCGLERVNPSEWIDREVHTIPWNDARNGPWRNLQLGQRGIVSRPLHPATTFQIQRMEGRIKGGWSIGWSWINGSNLRTSGESKR